MERLILTIFLLLLAVTITANPTAGQPTGQTAYQPTAILAVAANPETESAFETYESTDTQTIPFKQRYELDPNLPCGEERITQEGREGTVTRRYQRTVWQGSSVGNELLSTDEEAAVEEIITLGTKPGEVFTADGYQYNCILKHFWATSYDGNCAGCSGRTHYTDEPVDYGICAVNPDLILPLSHFYIPGYGRCRAADKGGGIKGRRVDLGFNDIKNGWWHAHYTDIFLFLE